MTAARQAKGGVHFELKSDGPEGSFIARFATLNVVDSDSDITRPGAYTEGKSVLIGAYDHNTDALPTGKGVIHSDENTAWIEGQFNLKTQAGRDTYEAVKDAGDLMEWSYIDRATDVEYGTTPQGKRVRYLNAIDVWSVDPVLKGAGVGTGTLTVKARKFYDDGGPEGSLEELIDRYEDAFHEQYPDGMGDYSSLVGTYPGDHIIVQRWGDDDPEYQVYPIVSDDANGVVYGAPQTIDVAIVITEAASDGKSFVNQANAAVAATSALVTHAKTVAGLRAKEGRALSASTRAALAGAQAALASATETLTALCGEDETPKTNDMAAEAMRFESIVSVAA